MTFRALWGSAPGSWPPRVLALLWLVATLANVGKAVHIDDPTHLLIARHILEDPLHPMSGSLVLSGEVTSIASTNQPLLLYYGFALVMRVFGESIVALHLLISLFSGLAIYSFYGLASQICPGNALGLTVIFALGPAFLPAQNLMTDVPTVSLWLLVMWILVRGRDAQDRGRSYLAAGVVTAAACLIKYPSLVLLPILSALILYRRDWRYAWAPLIPVVALFVWSIFNVFDFGAVHVLTRPSRPLALLPVEFRLETWMICLGGVAPFSILFFVAPRWRPGLSALAVTALLIVVHPRWAPPDLPYEFAYAQILGWLFLLNANLVAAWTVDTLVRSRLGNNEDKLLLTGWIASGVGFIVLFAPFMAVRHVLLVLPAILLVVGLALEGRDTRAWMLITCALSTLFGGVVALSDWSYAEMYRTQARELRVRFEGEGDLWYCGNWGWRWYAEAEGMKPYLPGQSKLRKGDVVIIAATPTGPKKLAPDDRARGEFLGAIDVPAPATALVRTMTRQGGYYAIGRDGLPWHVSSEPFDRFGVVRVVRD